METGKSQSCFVLVKIRILHVFSVCVCESVCVCMFVWCVCLHTDNFSECMQWIIFSLYEKINNKDFTDVSEAGV